MHNEKRSVAWSVALVTVLGLVLLTQSAQAQTYKVIYNFTNKSDGAQPRAGLTIDNAGNFYGTTYGYPSGCDGTNCGTVYKLWHNGSGWTSTPLYTFSGGHDGANPEARVIIGPNGSLYGTTSEGGLNGVGTVFNLRSPTHASANILGGWTETLLYQFTGGTDGAYPAYGDLIFDAAGNIYGTTEEGG